MSPHEVAAGPCGGSPLLWGGIKVVWAGVWGADRPGRGSWRCGAGVDRCVRVLRLACFAEREPLVGARAGL